jgi:glycosyltransferase involved in cell wall biosynthesis
MHLCFLCNEYPPGPHGGVGSVTQTLAQALVARGHVVTVMGIYPAQQAGISQQAGVRVVRVPHTPVSGTGFLVNGARLSAALRKLQQTQPIDVLEGPETSLTWIPRRFPAVKVIRMHGGHHFFAVTLGRQPRAWRGWQERRSFARADQLCAVSRFVGETTRKLLGLRDRPIEVLPNPVDVRQFRPAPPGAEQAGLILFVGSVCEKKGVRQLVEAFPQIVTRVPEARLWIVGRDGRDELTGGSYTAAMRALIPSVWRERIVFKGAVERADLPALLARASVCVYPSHMEAMPMTWLEGMAMGKAVVASQTGPGAEMITDWQTGLLCDPHRPAAIAAALVRVLQDGALRARLGQAARRRVEAAFSLDVLAARNEAFYARCVREKNTAA